MKKKIVVIGLVYVCLLLGSSFFLKKAFLVYVNDSDGPKELNIGRANLRILVGK